MSWFKDRFKRGSVGAAVRRAFSGGRGNWEEVEEALILADVGAALTLELVRDARGRKGDPESALREVLLERLAQFEDRSLATSPAPVTWLVVGVNGTGKTTSVGKLAHRLVSSGRSVVLGAADTFRAAAAAQLVTWGERTGATVVRGADNADPAAVAFDAVARGFEEGADFIIIDTAGRLHTKQGLMDELSKVRRVIERKVEVSEVLLVLDATTGQNGLVQAKVFAEAVAVTGIILTKLDGTAKGGIVLAVEQQLGVPVKLVGMGEGKEDLVDFDPVEYVDALLD